MSSSILNKSYIYSIDSGTYLVKTNSTIKLSPSSYSHVALSTSHYAASKNSTLYISSLVSNHSAQLSLPLVISSIQWCSLLLVVSTLDKTYIISKDGGILRDFIPGIIASNSFLWPSLFIWNNNSLNVCILPYLSHLDQEKLPDLRDGSYWTDQLINHHEQQLEQHKGISYPLKGTLSTLFTSLINVESELENVLHMATKSNETFMFLFSLSPNSVSISVIEYLDPIWPNKTFDIPKLYTLSKISIPIENGRLRVDPQYDRIYAFNETSVFMIDFQNILKNQKPTLEWIVDVTDFDKKIHSIEIVSDVIQGYGINILFEKPVKINLDIPLKMPISRLLKTVDFPIIIKQKQHQEILIPKHSFSNSGTEVYPDFINPETLKQIAAYISQSRCALVNILDWDIGNRVDVQQEQIRIFYNVYKTILDKLDHFESLNKKNTILLDKINEKNKKLNNRVGILMDISSRISGVPLSSSEIDFQKQVHIVESFCIGADGLLDNFEKNLEGRETRRGTGGSLVGADQVFSLLVQEKKAVDDALKAFDELHLMVDSSDV